MFIKLLTVHNDVITVNINNIDYYKGVGDLFTVVIVNGQELHVQCNINELDEALDAKGRN